MRAEPWLDRFGKIVGSGRSRRHVLRAVAGLAVGATVGGTMDQAIAADPCNIAFHIKRERKFCKTKRKLCQRAGTDFCIHIPDDDHPDTHATCCPRGEVCCGNICIDLATSVSHCGQCGAECAIGESCVDGACVPFSPPCPDGRTLCAGACVDTSDNPGHCGGCGIRCPAAQRCVAGACVCPGSNNVLCGGFNCIPNTYTCCPGGYGCSSGASCRPGGGCGH